MVTDIKFVIMDLLIVSSEERLSCFDCNDQVCDVREAGSPTVLIKLMRVQKQLEKGLL